MTENENLLSVLGVHQVCARLKRRDILNVIDTVLNSSCLLSDVLEVFICCQRVIFYLEDLQSEFLVQVEKIYRIAILPSKGHLQLHRISHLRILLSQLDCLLLHHRLLDPHCLLKLRILRFHRKIQEMTSEIVIEVIVEQLLIGEYDLVKLSLLAEILCQG